MTFVLKINEDRCGVEVTAGLEIARKRPDTRLRRTITAANGKSLQSKWLGVAFANDKILAELDWLVEDVFNFGREYEAALHEPISASKVAKEFFGYKGLPEGS